ncbi:MAG: hypothetical protein HQL23_03015 [Candidatus Omnitrophica bacterium]|nr:hypothetical protein [Candidatus Omnitrophota bacterium]
MQKTSGLFCLICQICIFISGAQLTARAENSEVDRRIEQEKRNSLKHTAPEAVEGLIAPPRRSETRKSDPQKLFSRPVSVFSEGVALTVILLRQDPAISDFSSSVDYLSQKKILPAAWEGYAPEKILRRGELALLITGALKISGGICLRLFPRSTRYAVRELIYNGMMRCGGVNDPLTGTEMRWILTAAEKYRDAHGK